MVSAFATFLLGLMIGGAVGIFFLKWVRQLFVQALKDQMNGRGTGPLFKAVLSSLSTEALATSPAAGLQSGAPAGLTDPQSGTDGLPKQVDLGAMLGGLATALFSGMNLAATANAAPGGSTPLSERSAFGQGGGVANTTTTGAAAITTPAKQNSGSSIELKKVVKRSGRQSVSVTTVSAIDAIEAAVPGTAPEAPTSEEKATLRTSVSSDKTETTKVSQAALSSTEELPASSEEGKKSIPEESEESGKKKQD
jgi:hypothetical protein